MTDRARAAACLLLVALGLLGLWPRTEGEPGAPPNDAGHDRDHGPPLTVEPAAAAERSAPGLVVGPVLVLGNKSGSVATLAVAAAPKQEGGTPHSAATTAAMPTPVGLQYDLWRKRFVLPSGVRTVVVEVGPHDQPETAVLAGPSTLVVALEPQRAAAARLAAAHAALIAQRRLVAVPVAVGPGAQGWRRLHGSALPGCTSLLPQSPAAKAHAAAEQARGGDKHRVTAFRTAEYCARRNGTVAVPVVPLSSIFAALPPEVPVGVLVVDAQGFDLAVLASLASPPGDLQELPQGRGGASARHSLPALDLPSVLRRLGAVVLECQDVAPDDPRLLTTGAATCAQQQACLSPDTRAADVKPPQGHGGGTGALTGALRAAGGLRLLRCFVNSRVMRELNCVYAPAMSAAAGAGQEEGLWSQLALAKARPATIRHTVPHGSLRCP